MKPRVAKALWGAFIAAVGLTLAFAYYRFVLSPSALGFKWSSGANQYELLEPRFLGVLLVIPLLLFVLGRSLADLPWPQRVLSILLRTTFLGLLALGLARLSRSAESHRVCTIFLLDVSESVSDAAIEDARAVVERGLKAKGREDRVELITFAERPRAVELGSSEQPVPPVHALRASVLRKSGAAGSKELEGTNLQAALQLAYGVFPPGYLKRAVLLSDGVETRGDILAEVNRAREFRVRVYAVPSHRPAPAEVAVQSLHVPNKVDIGQTFDVTAEIHASRATNARVRLYQGESLNGLDAVRELSLHPGNNTVQFKSVVRVGGRVTYTLKVEPLGPDKFKQNNVYAVTVDVPGRPSVLYVEGQPERATYLTRALSAQEFDVEVRSPAGFPGSMQELERYDFVIVSDVEQSQLGVSAQNLVEKYVRDLGGGFLFAGGEAGYGLGGWAHSTIERILPVRMDAERRKDMPSVAMALVIDRSGSMTGLPMEMAKAACRATVSTLSGDDLIEVIAFDSTPLRYVKMEAARYRARIQNDIARIQPGGGTEIFPALDMAYQDMSVTQARKKHVVLLTDGRAPVQGIRDLVQAMLSESITVTTVGLGEGADHDFLRSIADAGGGRYHAASDPNSLPKIFTRETELVSRQAAVEDWFPVQQTANADFLKGIAINQAPLLHGYVATQMKPPPATLILASDRGEPILARWRVGLGWTLAWTSDVKNLWATDWLKWPAFGKFWGQLVREHMRSKSHRELDMTTEVIGNRVRAVVSAFTLDERFDNDLDSKLSVTGPEPGGARREYPMRQTAPGRYEADFELTEYGSFLLRAEHWKGTKTGDPRQVAVSYGQISNPYPREYASFEPDVERLRRAALAGGGDLNGDPRAYFAAGDEKIVYYEELWGRFVAAALAVFFLDLLVRRVRLFDRKFVPRQNRASRA